MTLDARIVWGAILGLTVVGTVMVMAVPATAKPDESAPLPGLAVSAAAGPADVLPGESTTLSLTLTNTGGTTLPALTLTEDLPAAVSYAPSSVVAVVTTRDGDTTTYTGSGATGAVPLAQLTPGEIISPWDGIELAPGDRVQVSLVLTVNPALAPSVDALSITTVASAGDAAATTETLGLGVLRQALAFATDGGTA
jgi:uncharacterized repeat protein (TIGR01451 family)